MNNILYYTFGLLSASSDLELLGEQLNQITKNADRDRQTAQHILDALLHKLPSYSSSDQEAWQRFAHEVYDDLVEFRLPRIIYNPFLVSMYATYESAVMEIAIIIQQRKTLEGSLNDFVRKRKRGSLAAPKDIFVNVSNSIYVRATNPGND